MHDESLKSNIIEWLKEVRESFLANDPDLIKMYDIYAAEAVFGRKYIANDLEVIGKYSKIIEVGAGSLLLSCQLVREGYEVDSLEPFGKGFSHFERIRKVVLEVAKKNNCCPNIINSTAECLNRNNVYDYAFSVNVMEHVNDIELSINNVVRSLKKGSKYRFTCPNYSFPYEPHFNIPTFLNKKTTERIFKKKIKTSNKLDDPIGTWESLNWINVALIENIIMNMQGCKLHFYVNMVVEQFERILKDKQFALRRSWLLRTLIKIVVSTRLHLLFLYIPVRFQPIIDCEIMRYE